MPITEYRVTTEWRVRGRAEDVARLFADPASLPRWWPATFLRVREEVSPNRRSVRVHARGPLPYTLRLQVRLVRGDYPHGCVFHVRGDLVGRARCRLLQEGAHVRLFLDWRVRVRKPVLRTLSLLLKPLFVANHRWSMRRGRRCLEAELERLDGAPETPSASPAEPARARRPGRPLGWREPLSETGRPAEHEATC